MKRADAERYAERLRDAWVVDGAHVEPLHASPRWSRLHGGNVGIGGRFAGSPGHGTLIGCAHVAEALLKGWSVEALRACRHQEGTR